MRALLLASLLCACGTSRPAAPPVIANHAHVPARPTCDVPALVAHVQLQWRTAERVDIQCTPGRFPTPGYFVEARAGLRHEVGIVEATSFRTVTPLTTERPRDAMVATIQRATADLDGDGIDEIVETWRDSAHARTGIGNRMVVRHVQGRQLSMLPGPHVAIFHPGLGGCWAQARVEPRGLVVTVEHVMGIPPSDCLDLGVHRFVLDRGSMRQARRP